MKVIVDFDACAAHGDCVAAAPEIFDLGYAAGGFPPGYLPMLL